MDTSIYSTLLTAHEHGVTTITVWCQFTLKNKNKTEYMIVSRRRTPATQLSPLLLEGQPLDQVELYSGVFLSHDLTWGEHVHSICSKARKILGLWSLQITLHQVLLYFNCTFPSLASPGQCGNLVLLVEEGLSGTWERSEFCMPHAHQSLGQ